MFSCRTLLSKPEHFWLRADLREACFIGSHLRWSVAVGLPALLVWAVGLPAGAATLLWKRRGMLADLEIKEHYGASLWHCVGFSVRVQFLGLQASVTTGTEQPHRSTDRLPPDLHWDGHWLHYNPGGWSYRTLGVLCPAVLMLLFPSDCPAMPLHWSSRERGHCL